MSYWFHPCWQPVHEAQLCGAELLEAVFLLFPNRHHFGGVEPIVEVSKRLVRVQKELGLSYTPELSTVTSSLFVLLIQSEFEHDQLSILKLLIFLMKWRSENGKVTQSCFKCVFTSFTYIALMHCLLLIL